MVGNRSSKLLIQDLRSPGMTLVSLGSINKPTVEFGKTSEEKGRTWKNMLFLWSLLYPLDAGRRLCYLALSESKNLKHSQARMLKSVLGSRNKKIQDTETAANCRFPRITAHQGFSLCRTELVVLLGGFSSMCSSEIS